MHLVLMNDGRLPVATMQESTRSRWIINWMQAQKCALVVKKANAILQHSDWKVLDRKKKMELLFYATTGEVCAIFVCFSSLCIKKQLKNSAPTAGAEFVYHVPVEVSLHDTFCIGHRFSLVCRAPGICIAELIGKAWICTTECIFRFSCCYSISSSQPN